MDKKLHLYSGPTFAGGDGLSATPVTRIGPKPAVICFGGNVNTTRDAASKTLHFVVSTLGRVNVLANDIDVMVGVYPYDEEKLDNITKYHINAAPRGHFDAAAFQFVSERLLPLFTKERGIEPPYTVTGKKRTLEEVKRQFRALNFVAYSLGGMVTEQVGNALVNCMTQIGYTPEEISEATNQILVLTVGAVTTTNKGLANFKQVDLINLDDQQIQKRMRQEGYSYGPSSVLGHLQALEQTHEKEGGEIALKHPLNIVMQHPNRVAVVCDHIGRTTVEDGETSIEGYLNTNHFGQWRDELGFRFPKLDQHGHTLSTYMSPKPAHNGLIMPLIAQNILANGINSSVLNSAGTECSPLPEDIMALLEVPTKVLFKKTEDSTSLYNNPGAVARMIGYEKRIKEATIEDGKARGPVDIDRYPHLEKLKVEAPDHDFSRLRRKRQPDSELGM